MANWEQLRVLKQGVEIWNEWREEHGEVRPDLSDADLYKADLGAAELRGANRNPAILTAVDLRGTNLGLAYLRRVSLDRAQLCGANLGGADLQEANLARTNLCRANLQRAILTRTDLRRADLSGADLREADLWDADLGGATLTNSDLTGAVAGWTRFTNNDLSEVRGLEAVRHGGPSTIGIDTIYRSKGNVPEVFLRGAGLPEDFIVYMRSLFRKPFEFYSCFISYSSKDQDFAERLHTDLQNQGVRCWFAPEDLRIGDKFRTRIDESIRVYDKLMVVLSENSIRSPWVEEEVEAALEKEQQQNNLVLFPIRLDAAVMDTDQAWAASLRRIRHIGNFTTWKDHDSYQKALERLLRDLKAEETDGTPS